MICVVTFRALDVGSRMYPYDHTRGSIVGKMRIRSGRTGHSSAGRPSRPRWISQ